MKKTFCFRALALVLAAVWCLPSLAISEMPGKRTTGKYDFWATKTWNALPNDGDAVQIAAYSANVEMGFSKDVDLGMIYLDFKCGESVGATLFFNGDRRVFGVKDVPAEATWSYNGTPLRFKEWIKNDTINNSDLSYMQATCSSTKLGSYKWTNPVFTVRCNEDWSITHDFTKGDYNFYDPNGTVLTDGKLTFGDAAAVTSKVTFGPETSLQISDIVIGRNGGDPEKSVVVFDGSAVDVYRNLTVNKGGKLFVVGGASLTMHKNGVGIVSHEGVVISNATVTISSECEMAMGGTDNPTLTLEEDGTFLGDKLALDMGHGDGKTATLNIRGGRMTVKGGNALMAGYNGGSVTINQSGGTFNPARMRLGRYTAPATSTVKFVMTGGEYRDSAGIEFQQNDGKDGATPENLGSHWVQLDGGVCRSLKIFRVDTATAGMVRLLADGGTFGPIGETSASAPLVYNLTRGEFGPKGLTLNTYNLKTYVKLNAQDQDERGGLFVKTGSGDLTLDTTSWTVSTNIVRKDRLVLARSTEMRTVIVDGGVLSLQGAATELALDGLAVSGGTIELDPGDKIVVNGPVDLQRLTITWTANPQDASDFLVIDGPVTPETMTALRTATHTTAAAAGRHVKYEPTYDESTGKTTIKAAEVDDEPLPDSANVNWTGSGAWLTAANWNPQALPTADNRAVFESGSKEVAVAGGAVAGALAFKADGFTLTGEGPLVIDGDIGSAEVAVSAGSQTIDVPLKLYTSVSVPLAAETTLEIAKNVDSGELKKSGTGKLVLSGANTSEKGVVSADGVVEAAHAEAFGGRATLSGGTVCFREPNGAPMAMQGTKFAVSAANSSDVVVFDVETDVAVDSLNVTKGAFIKRGVGKLTYEIPGDANPLLCSGNGNAGANYEMYKNAGIKFPADGTTPTDGQYPGFSVAEGEMVLKGAEAGAKATIMGKSIVGLFASVCRVQPVLTVDNVDLDAGSSEFYVGFETGESGVAVTNPTLRIVNGARVSIGSSQMGYASTSPRCHACIAATNGTLRFVPNGCYLSRAYGYNGNYVHYRFKDSTLSLDNESLKLGGGIDLDFDNSVFSRPNDNVIALTAESDRPNGKMVFRNGSRFVCRYDEGTAMNKPLSIVFDDAEWLLRHGGETATVQASKSGCVHYEVRGVGVVLKPAADNEYVFLSKFEGSGGLVVDGAGTVKLGAGAYAFTGTSDVRQGVLDLTEAGTVADTSFAGAGTVRGGSFGAISIKASEDVLTFAGCTFGGTVKVDLGCTEEHPATETDVERVIANVDGGLSAGSVKLVGTGAKGLRGTFAVKDGKLVLTSIYHTGAMVIVR